VNAPHDASLDVAREGSTGDGGVEGSADAGQEAASDGSVVSTVDPPCQDGECAPDRVCNPVTALCEPACDVPRSVDPLSPWPMFAGCPTNRGLSRYVGASSGTVKWSVDLGSSMDLFSNRSPTIGRDGTLYLPYVSASGYPSDVALHAYRPDGTLRFVGPASALPPSIARDGTLWLALPAWRRHHRRGSERRALHAAPEASVVGRFELPKRRNVQRRRRRARRDDLRRVD
jgi:hypothetical protein